MSRNTEIHTRRHHPGEDNPQDGSPWGGEAWSFKPQALTIYTPPANQDPRRRGVFGGANDSLLGSRIGGSLSLLQLGTIFFLILSFFLAAAIIYILLS